MHGVADRLQQVGLAEPDAAVHQARVVRASRILGDGDGRVERKRIALALDHPLERVVRVELTVPPRCLGHHRWGDRGSRGRRGRNRWRRGGQRRHRLRYAANHVAELQAPRREFEQRLFECRLEPLLYLVAIERRGYREFDDPLLRIMIGHIRKPGVIFLPGESVLNPVACLVPERLVIPVISHLFAPSPHGAERPPKNRHKAPIKPFHAQVIHRSYSRRGLRALPAAFGAAIPGRASSKVYKNSHGNKLLGMGKNPTAQLTKPVTRTKTLQLLVAH